MDTIIYLSNTNIEVVEGTAKPKGVVASKVHSASFPEGTLLNGVITDAQTLIEVLKATWEHNNLPKKGVRLVVNTPQISVRLIDVPLLSQIKTIEYLKREFATNNEKSVGFFRVSEDSKNKVSKVCAEVADTSFIDEYRQVFHEAGIEVDEINSAIGVAVNLLNITMFAKGKNCVVMMRDGMTVTSIFFVNGEYYYSTTTRAFNSLGTEEFARELANTVNQIDQFAKSQKIEEPITHVYLTGMTEADTDFFSAVLVDTYSSDIHVQTLRQLVGVKLHVNDRALDKLFYPIAGLSDLNKSVNILKMVKKELGGEKVKKQEKLAKLSVPYAAVLFVMIVITIIYITNNFRASSKLKALEDYNTDAANQAAELQYDEYVKDAAILAQHSTGLDLMEEYMNSYPLVTSKIIYDIGKVAKRLGNVNIYSYTADSGNLGINATFTDMDVVNEFIKQLSKEDYIESVDYKGYTESDDTNEWIAHVTVTLNEYAGKSGKPKTTEAKDSEEVVE